MRIARALLCATVLGSLALPRQLLGDHPAAGQTAMGPPEHALGGVSVYDDPIKGV